MLGNLLKGSQEDMQKATSFACNWHLLYAESSLEYESWVFFEGRGGGGRGGGRVDPQ